MNEKDNHRTSSGIILTDVNFGIHKTLANALKIMKSYFALLQ